MRLFRTWDPDGRNVGMWPDRQKLREEYPRQATALVPAEGGLIVWKPYVFSPHTREELNVDSVPVISCTGAENCLHGQLTRYVVPSVDVTGIGRVATVI